MRSTLDLKENPFDPVLPGLGHMTGRPLEVDVNRPLIRLVCWNVADTKKHYRTLRQMIVPGRKPGNAPVERSAILLIVGPRGSGRSTLARLLLRRVRAAATPSAVPWQRFDLPFELGVPPPSVDRIEAQFADLAKRIATTFPDGAGNAAVLFENLPRDCFQRVINVFDACSPGLKRVFIVTSDDTAEESDSLAKRDLSYGSPTRRVVLKKLTAEDVRSFIAARLPRYRCNRITMPATEPEFSLFPFAASAPQSAVPNGAKPLRSVNTWLWESIDDRHAELDRPGLVDVAQAGADELRRRLIP